MVVCFSIGVGGCGAKDLGFDLLVIFLFRNKPISSKKSNLGIIDLYRRPLLKR